MSSTSSSSSSSSKYHKLKIGFDAKRVFHNYTGLGNYSRGVVQNLAQHYPNDYNIHLFTPKFKASPIAQSFQQNFTIHTASKKPAWYWRTFRMTNDLEQQNIDIYHGLTHELPRGIHRSKVKTVLTVHDLIFKIYPHQYKLIDRKIYDWKLKYACKVADKIVAISEHTKRDIIKYYKVPAEKISVIYQSCDNSFSKEKTNIEINQTLKKHQLPQDFLLYVGSIIERKNLLTLVKAMQQVDEMPLVIVGNGKSYKKQVLEYIQKHHLEQKIIFLKNVSNEDLASLYQQAQIFIYPSLYEGFGIPIIEAIFSKTPVITTSQSALPEAGGAFCHYIESTNEDELAVKIKAVLNDPKQSQEMVEKSLAYVQQQFSAKKTASDLHQLYQKLS